jgi:hypothetical protein
VVLPPYSFAQPRRIHFIAMRHFGWVALIVILTVQHHGAAADTVEQERDLAQMVLGKNATCVLSSDTQPLMKRGHI